MPRIGILCDRDEEMRTIRYIMELSAAREGIDCSVCCIDTEQGCCGGDLSCVVLSCENTDTAFGYARRLWRQEPSLHIIFVAHKAEDIFEDAFFSHGEIS